ncbi:Nn.00g064220.m01.CDS01 [Neocucurbitaria sp. VM-36]
MRGRVATVAAATTILFVIIGLFISAPKSWRFGGSPASVAGHHPYTKPDPLPWNPPSSKDPSGEDPADRVIVKIKLEDEDPSWIDSLFPTWRKDIVTIGQGFSKLHEGGHRVDKGRIANAYLTWIIENYNNLPNTMVFLPPDQRSQRTSRAGSDLKNDISNLQIPFIQSSGFVNLQCPSPATCADLILPFRSPPNEFRTLEVAMPKAWEGIFGNITVPEQLATPPGAKFAVSKTQVQRRKVEEYLKAWQWLNRTVMDDDTGGLVFEHLWHVIFGRDAVFCPEEKKCECEVYGECEK